MRARFIGEDGSMGFRNGLAYELITHLGYYNAEQVIWVRAVNNGHLVACPYSGLENFMENWFTTVVIGGLDER